MGRFPYKRNVLRLSFVAHQYALLLLLVAAAWGLGRTILRRADRRIVEGPFRHAVPLAGGLGVLIVVLQLLAIGGLLRLGPLLAVILLGGSFAIAEAFRSGIRSSWARCRAGWHALDPAGRLLVAGALVLAASLVLRPLAPPQEWDELMYHLPHARQWALSGQLTVDEWLRYPWFPYNYNLLYAAALVAGSDVLPHLIHATAGWCTALLLFSWARLHWGVERAVLGAMLWLWLARPLFGNAYIDLGVTLFVLLGVVAMERWRAERAHTWLLLCAFALGVATGTKYQALTLLPFFALALWGARPSPRLFAAALLLFLLPCAYWYGRNFLLAGDPVAPLGAHVFGFADWNEADYRGQMLDLRHAAGLPEKVLWPAAVGIVAFAMRGRGGPRFAAAFGAWAVLAWAATSGYPRYLLPAYPVLAILAVWAWLEVPAVAARRLRAGTMTACITVGAALVLAGAVASAARELPRSWRAVAATPAQRQAVLARSIAGYAVWQYLAAHPHRRVYQFGAEGWIYYAPVPVFGDFFGPWRYRDYMSLDPKALHERLTKEGFDALVVHTGRMPWVVDQPGFGSYFALERQDGPVLLYSLRKGPLS